MSLLGGILGIGGALLGGILGNESADAQSDAVRDSTDAQVDLAREIYDSQTELNQPLIDFRDDRLSYLNALRGFGGGGGAVSTQAQPARTNAFASNSVNPLGPTRPSGTFGGAIYDGVGREAGISPYGQTNAFATPYATGGQPQTQSPGMTQQDAMQMFYDSPEYRTALMGFEDQGDDFIANQAAIGGLYSGATMKGLSDIERRNAFGAFGNYYGNIMSEAGFGQTGAANQSNAAQSYGSTVGNALGNQGFANANAAGQRYSAYGNAIGNAFGVAANQGWL